jgi:hypothetical protein
MINQTEGKYHQADDASKARMEEASNDRPEPLESSADEEAGKAESMIAAMAERMWGDAPQP